LYKGMNIKYLAKVIGFHEKTILQF
jgi:hypothetical protein